MALVIINGQVYEETTTQIPVSLEEEEKKLAWMDGALETDAREKAEYEAAVAEIDATDLPEDVKKQARASKMYSPSGIKQEDTDKQRAYVDEIKKLKKTREPKETKKT